MRFYTNDAETRAGNLRRGALREALAELPRVPVEDGARMVAEAVHPEFRAFLPSIAATAAVTPQHARDAARKLRAFAGVHAERAAMTYIPEADREAWKTSADALNGLAGRAEAGAEEARHVR